MRQVEKKHIIPKVACFPSVPIPRPATLAVMTTLEGSSMVARFCNSGANSRIRLNTPRTLRSITLANALSGCVSNFSPHVAPALASKMSTWAVCLDTSATRCLIPSRVALSEGTEMAVCSWRLIPGREFRVLTAESQAAAFREEMNTLEAPAWRSLLRCRK